jgi:deazaflavin-dependent oxidoreductase (nitroreductase family)
MNEIGTISVSPRVAIHQELEATRQAFHALISSLQPSDWDLPAATPGWTIGDSLYHMVLGLRVVAWEAFFIRLGIWYPRLSPELFDRLDPHFTHLLAQQQTFETIGDRYERAYASLIGALESIRDEQWSEGASRPDYDPANIDGFVSLDELFRSVRQHFETHREDIHQALAILQPAPTLKSLEKETAYTQAESNWLSYPTSFWRKLLFKAPIELWRLGLGWLVGWVLMLITHTGRISGFPRRTMVEYHSLHGVKYAPCAFGPRSDWYQNIVANPNVVIQTIHGAERVKVVRVTDDHELLRVFALFMRRDPPLLKAYLASFGIQATPEDVLAKKERIYWLRFDPTSSPTPPPQKADLAWIWLVALAGGIIAWLYNRQHK